MSTKGIQDLINSDPTIGTRTQGFGDRASSETSLGSSREGAPGAQPSLEPPPGYRRLSFGDVDAPRLTHYLFRFPAKFHPPVVHTLLRNYTTKGQTVLDPFCGSGTLLVAAAAEDRNAVGIDVDPVATFVSMIKTHRYRASHLRSSWRTLSIDLDSIRRSTEEYYERQFDDISMKEYLFVTSTEGLAIPKIPNLMHWFRRYVIVDLARIRTRIHNCDIPETHRQFFRLIFASIIRGVSNADPIPVSGLEVTAHMRALEAAGRLVDPFDLFYKATRKGLQATTDYSNKSTPRSKISVVQADVTSLGTRFCRDVDAIITSPPYHNAVDYYRRHQLEMFWLDFTTNQAQRLKLLPKYIGRPRINQTDPILQRGEELGRLSSSWYERMRCVSTKRANAFLHYAISIKDTLGQLAPVVRRGGMVVFVLGHSNWNGYQLPTSDMFLEMAVDHFDLVEKLWYPTKNRYMSYGRHNGADINEEYVLVLSRSNQ